MRYPDDLIIVNCAGCRGLLQSSRSQVQRTGPDAGKCYLPVVRGRIDGRCYCAGCWADQVAVRALRAGGR